MNEKLVKWLADHISDKYLSMWMYEDKYSSVEDVKPVAMRAEVGQNYEPRIAEEWDRSGHVIREGVYNLYVSQEYFDAAWPLAVEYHNLEYAG